MPIRKHYRQCVDTGTGSHHVHNHGHLSTGTGSYWDISYHGRKIICGSCCMYGGNCKTGCSTCLPRYICMHVSQHYATGTGSICCDTYSERLLPDGACGWQSSYSSCGNGVLGYVFVQILNRKDYPAGTGTSNNEYDGQNTKWSLTGTGTGTDSECFTRVTGTLIQGHLDFPGVLSNVTFTVTDHGIHPVTYTVNLSAANMVHNPQAYVKCAPCTCVTCIPAELCVQCTVVFNDYKHPGIEYSGTVYVTAPWDCWQQAWICPNPITVTTQTPFTGTAIEFTGTGGFPPPVTRTFQVSIRLAQASDKVGCAIIVGVQVDDPHTGTGGIVHTGTGTGSSAYKQFVIALESPGEGPEEGATCIENNGVVTIAGGGQPFTVNTVINFVDYVRPDIGTSRTNVGETVKIFDKSCNQDCNPPDCTHKVTHCGDCLLLESSFFLTFSSSCQKLNGLTIYMQGYPGGWVGSGNKGNCNFRFAVSCVNNAFTLTGNDSGVGACGYGAQGSNIVCSPVWSGKFINGTLSCLSGSSNPCCHSGDTFTATITA